jgi:hypothetical protein
MFFRTMRLKLSSLVMSALLLAFAANAADAQRKAEGAPRLRYTEAAPQFGDPALPHMAPELALHAFEQRIEQQRQELAAYSAITDIEAELPETAQRGDYELEREYTAPNELHFKPVRFTGDNFVKTNVIGRLLQSEVDHVSKDDVGATAITPVNYKFNYKGEEMLGGRPVHVFQIKPRRKMVGLFKGKIYLDARTGALRRAEGSAVKSPSFFIKKIEFVQDYCDVGSFTLPLRTRSTAVTRVVGRAIVNIFHRNYQARATSGAVVSARADAGDEN